MRDKLERHLNHFRQLSAPGPYAYRWVFHHDGGQHKHHLVFGLMIHGNEFGSLPAAIAVIEALKSGQLTTGGQVTFFVGNPEAALQNRRFLEADLNRVFLESADDTHEGRRARQLMPILDDCDVFIDFHQTIVETRQPFYIFPWDEVGWQWARVLQAAKVWVTRHPEAAFSAGTCCADEYVRQQNKPGLTLELSEKGFNPAAEALAYSAMVEAIATRDKIALGEASLSDLADTKPDLTFFHTVYREPFTTADLQLRTGLVNFLEVTAEQRLSSPSCAPLLAPDSGLVLFPKYPPRTDGLADVPLPKDIYRIIQKLPCHPLDLYRE
jgi:hypothetical protein